MSRKRIALVNQRYGMEVNGGSEYYTRLIAKMLRPEYDIEILTTRALDYITWDNYYQEGLQEEEGIKVRRFTVDRSRDFLMFRILTHILKYVKNTFLEMKWIDAQGPLSNDLIRFIQEHKDEYDVFIFVTYLYYHTVKGLPEVANKAILIPTAHDEPYINYSIYKRIFTLPKAIIYLTEEEKNFVQKTFHNETITNDVIGIGVNVPDNVSPDRFRKKYGVTGNYIIYVGRIDPEKGCNILLDYFLRFQVVNNTSDLKLVLVGKKMMEIPENKNIISLGFVSEEDKFDAIAGSRVLILPSEYESLSISVLEAMSLSVPVLVNGKCSVLKGHCEKSHGGLYYNDYDDFEARLNTFLEDDKEEYLSLKRNARKYIDANYTWNVCKSKFQSVITKNSDIT